MVYNPNPFFRAMTLTTQRFSSLPIGYSAECFCARRQKRFPQYLFFKPN